MEKAATEQEYSTIDFEHKEIAKWGFLSYLKIWDAMILKVPLHIKS